MRPRRPLCAVVAWAAAAAVVASAASPPPRLWFVSEKGVHSCDPDGSDLVMHQAWADLTGYCGLDSRGFAVDESIGVALVTCGRKLYSLDVTDASAAFAEIDLATKYSLYGVGINQELHVGYVAVLESVDGWVVKGTYLGDCKAITDADLCKQTNGCLYKPDRGGCLQTTRFTLMSVGSEPYGGGLYTDSAGVTWLTMGEAPGHGAVISRQERKFVEVPNVLDIYARAQYPDLVDISSPVYANESAFVTVQVAEGAVSELYRADAEGVTLLHPSLPVFKGYISGQEEGAQGSPNFAIIDEGTVVYARGGDLYRQSGLPCTADPCTPAAAVIATLDAPIGAIYYRTPEGPPPTPEPPTPEPPTDAPPTPEPETPLPPTGAPDTAPPATDAPEPAAVFTPSPITAEGTAAPATDAPATDAPGTGVPATPAPPGSTPMPPLPGGTPSPPVTIYIPVPGGGGGGDGGTNGAADANATATLAQPPEEEGTSELLVILAIAIILILLVGGLIYICCKKRKKRERQQAEEAKRTQTMVSLAGEDAGENEVHEEPSPPPKDPREMSLDRSLDIMQSTYDRLEAKEAYNPLAGFGGTGTDNKELDATARSAHSEDPARRRGTRTRGASGPRGSISIPGRRRDTLRSSSHLVDIDNEMRLSDVQARRGSTATGNRAGNPAKRSVTPVSNNSMADGSAVGSQRPSKAAKLEKGETETDATYTSSGKARRQSKSAAHTAGGGGPEKPRSRGRRASLSAAKGNAALDSADSHFIAS